MKSEKTSYDFDVPDYIFGIDGDYDPLEQRIKHTIIEIEKSPKYKLVTKSNGETYFDFPGIGRILRSPTLKSEFVWINHEDRESLDITDLRTSFLIAAEDQNNVDKIILGMLRNWLAIAAKSKNSQSGKRHKMLDDAALNMQAILTSKYGEKSWKDDPLYIEIRLGNQWNPMHAGAHVAGEAVYFKNISDFVCRNIDFTGVSVSRKGDLEDKLEISRYVKRCYDPDPMGPMEVLKRIRNAPS